MNEHIRNSSENLSLIEILNSTLDQLNVYFDNSFLNQDINSILTQLLKINIKPIQPHLADTIKVAITILYLILYPNLVVAEEAVVKAPSGLKLRTGASTDSSIVQVLPLGTKVNVLSDEGNWAGVDINGDNAQDGWVSKTWLTFGNDETPTTTEVETGVRYIFSAKNCNNDYELLDAGYDVCRATLHVGSAVIGEGFYAHNYSKWGKWIANLIAGDNIQINLEDGTILKFKVSDKRLISNANDASKIMDPNYFYYLWTTNQRLQNEDPTAKIVLYLTPY